MTQPIQLLTVPEAAAALKVHRTFIYTLFRKKLLKRVKIGRLTRIRASDLQRYIDFNAR